MVYGCGSKLNTGGYAGFGPYFHLPGQPILESRFFEPEPYKPWWFGSVCALVLKRETTPPPIRRAPNQREAENSQMASGIPGFRERRIHPKRCQGLDRSFASLSSWRVMGQIYAQLLDPKGIHKTARTQRAWAHAQVHITLFFTTYWLQHGSLFGLLSSKRIHKDPGHFGILRGPFQKTPCQWAEEGAIGRWR